MSLKKQLRAYSIGKMNNLEQLIKNLRFWENLTLKSHWIVAINVLPVLIWDDWWAIMGLVISAGLMTFLFWKYMRAKHKVDVFGRDD